MKVYIPKDLTKYPKKVWLGLNLRQLIFLALSIALGIPFFFGVKNDLGYDISLFLSALVSIPIGCLGFVKVRGMYIEIIARTLFIQNFVRFKERKLLRKKVKGKKNVLKLNKDKNDQKFEQMLEKIEQEGKV